MRVRDMPRGLTNGIEGNSNRTARVVFGGLSGIVNDRLVILVMSVVGQLRVLRVIYLIRAMGEVHSDDIEPS